MQKIENITFDSYFYKRHPDLAKKKQKKKQQLQQPVTDDKTEELPYRGKRLIGKA